MAPNFLSLDNLGRLHPLAQESIAPGLGSHVAPGPVVVVVVVLLVFFLVVVFVGLRVP